MSGEVMTLNSSEREILRILNDDRYRWMYGLEIIEASNGKLKRGTIYVSLDRLEDKGFVRSRLETDQENRDPRKRKRRLYKITEDGLNQLDENTAGDLDPSLVPA